MANKKKAPRHGTTTGYDNYGCRCDPCRKASSEWRKMNRMERLQSGDYTHGANGYDIGCRCGICSAAKKEVQAKFDQASRLRAKMRQDGLVAKARMSSLA